MTISQTMSEGALSIELTGRLDTSTAPQLSKALDELLPEARTLTLDFAGLEYISSAGLRVLLQAQKIMAKKEGMVIRSVGETIAEVFEVTGFCDILTIE